MVDKLDVITSSLPETLKVVTNSIPDTLRIVLSTSDKADFWNQYSPLLIAAFVVVISSSIHLFIAYKQRKLEWFKVGDRAWLDHLQDLLGEYLSTLHEFHSEPLETILNNNLKNKILNDSDYIFNYESLLLHLDHKEQQELLKELLKFYDNVHESQVRMRNRESIKMHIEKVRVIFHKIAEKKIKK